LRLFQRRRSWFRIANISYTEVPDVDEAVSVLVGQGYALTSDDASHEGLIRASLLRSSLPV
jgi:hypothetical protein